MKSKKTKTKKSAIKSYFIPKENDVLEKFIIKNKTKLLTQVVVAIESAVINNENFVTIFNFDDSKFFVSVKKDEYMENIRNAFTYFFDQKDVEMCTRISKIQDLLK